MTRPCPARLLGPLSLALVASACSGPTARGHAHISSSQAPIQGGTENTDDTNIVGLQGIVDRTPNNDGSETLSTLLCTGSLIAPNLVLTARHCIARVASPQVTCGEASFNAPLSPRDVFVTTASEMPNDLGDYLPAGEILVPDEGNDVCGFDVALVVLRDNVPARLAQPVEPRLDDEVDVDETYRAVGYGATSGKEGGGDEGPAGVRRERTNLKASCVESGDGCALSDGSEWEGQQGVCEGDSGGPALDARGRVIGVASRSVIDDTSGDCLTPVYSAVAGWRDWIREVAKQAAEEGGYEPAAWVTASTGNGTGGNGQPVGGKSGSSQGGSGGSSGGDNPADDDSNGGCSAGAAGPAGSAPWLLGAALALAGGARRRARRAVKTATKE